MHLMSCEVLTAVDLCMSVLWVVSWCELVGRYRNFGEHTASTFRDNSLKLKAETLVLTYKCTLCCNPKNQDVQMHREGGGAF